MMPKSHLSSVKKTEDDRLAVTMDSGETLITDHVVVAVGGI